MPGKPWTDHEKNILRIHGSQRTMKELRKLLPSRQDSSIMNQMQRRGIRMNAATISRAYASRGLIDPASLHRYTEHWKLSGDWVISGDWHLPYVRMDLVERLVGIAQHPFFQITNLLLAGDILNMDMFSVYPKMPGEQRVGWQYEKGIAQEVFCRLLEWFTDIRWILANHEARLFRNLSHGGELEKDDLLALITSNPRIQMSSYPYAVLDGDLLVTHPSQFWKNKGRLAQELSTIEHKGIMEANAHVFAKQYDNSGKFPIVQIGPLVDGEKIGYYNLRPRALPKWNLAFWILKDGKLYDFHDEESRFSTWAVWEHPVWKQCSTAQASKFHKGAKR